MLRGRPSTQNGREPLERLMPKFHKKHKHYARVAKARESLVPAAPEAAEALLEVMTIAACVDGKLETQESHQLCEQIRATPGFTHLDNHALGRTVEGFMLRIAAEGLGARVRAIAKAIGDDIEAREEAFALATLFVLFDGEVGDEEQEFLELLQKGLHLSDDRASHISSLLVEAD
jgi:tellurite resistance protein